jgi:hypothetical protein
MASGSVIVRVAYVLVGRRSKTPVDVGDASTHGECLPLKIEIGPLRGEAFVDSQAGKGEQANQHTIIFGFMAWASFQPRQAIGPGVPLVVNVCDAGTIRRVSGSK